MILSMSEEGTRKSNARNTFQGCFSDTECIKYNTNRISPQVQKTLICSKSREGTAESSGATRFGNTTVDVQ